MLVCPHCDRELGIEHDAAGCRRKLSRRHFFGMLAGALGIAVATPVVGRMARTVEAVYPLCPSEFTTQQLMIMEAFRAEEYIKDQMDVGAGPIYDTITLASGLHIARSDTLIRRPTNRKQRVQRR